VYFHSRCAQKLKRLGDLDDFLVCVRELPRFTLSVARNNHLSPRTIQLSFDRSCLPRHFFSFSFSFLFLLLNKNPKITNIHKSTNPQFKKNMNCATKEWRRCFKTTTELYFKIHILLNHILIHPPDPNLSSSFSSSLVRNVGRARKDRLSNYKAL